MCLCLFLFWGGKEGNEGGVMIFVFGSVGRRTFYFWGTLLVFWRAGNILGMGVAFLTKRDFKGWKAGFGIVEWKGNAIVVRLQMKHRVLPSHLRKDSRISVVFC